LFSLQCVCIDSRFWSPATTRCLRRGALPSSLPVFSPLLYLGPYQKSEPDLSWHFPEFVKLSSGRRMGFGRQPGASISFFRSCSVLFLSFSTNCPLAQNAPPVRFLITETIRPAGGVFSPFFPTFCRLNDSCASVLFRPGSLSCPFPRRRRLPPRGMVSKDHGACAACFLPLLLLEPLFLPLFLLALFCSMFFSTTALRIGVLLLHFI